MPQPQRLLLARKAGGAGFGQDPVKFGNFERFSFLPQRPLELRLAIEVILDYVLVAARHEYEVLNAGILCLIDHVLEHRSVDHSQHLLRHRLGSWQKSSAKTCDREHGFADFTFHQGTIQFNF